MMKLTLGILIGAVGMFLVMWLTLGEQSDCRSITASYEQQLKETQWQAKLVQHRLAKTQRELGGHLAQKVGKIDDVMPIKALAVSKVDEEVASIAARAKSLAPVEAAVKQQATDNHEFIPAAFRSYWGQVLASGLMRGK